MSLPETLDETYSRILETIPGENKQNAVRILQLLTYSERPLSVAEVVDAIAVDVIAKPHFDPKYRMPDPDEIVVYCSSLVVMVPMSVNVDDETKYGEDDESIWDTESDTDSDEEPPYIGRFEVDSDDGSDDEYTSDENPGDALAEDKDWDGDVEKDDSDKDFEKDENSDNDCANEPHASGKHTDTMFVLQLAHFSVKEYFTSGRCRGPLSSELNETTARVSIAVVCLSYLLQFDQYLSHRKIVARFPFAQYCAASWLHNAAAVESESSELMTLLENLFYYNQAAYRVCYRLYCPDTASPSSWRDKGTAHPAPALYYAAMGNLYTTVKFLLDHGANVNAKGGTQSYALFIASMKGHEKVVQLLIERGANVNVFDGEYTNALMKATSCGHTRIVKLLLEHGVDVNARCRLGQNALVEAAVSYWGDTRMLKLLLDNGAYDKLSSERYSALEIFSQYGESEAVELLLERGAAVYRQDTRFMSRALKLACIAKKRRTVRLLLSKGTDMYVASQVWELFRHFVQRKIAETLLKEAYIAIRSNVPRSYGTLANFCASLGCTNLLRFIYENYETEIHVPDAYGRTPLHHAAEGGHMETFEYLITLGAEPTVLNAKGDGILYYAVVGGNIEIVSAILNKKLGSERYRIHWSPLHWALRVGHAKMVELLLDKDLLNHFIATDELEGQRSPLDVAICAREGEMLERLAAASRSLRGGVPNPERYSSKSSKKKRICDECRLVSPHKTIFSFVNVRVAISWDELLVSHMQIIIPRHL
jgi:ankyrin repeat protein